MHYVTVFIVPASWSLIPCDPVLDCFSDPSRQQQNDFVAENKKIATNLLNQPYKVEPVLIGLHVSRVSLQS